MTSFPHLDRAEIFQHVKQLLEQGLHIAFHADADGFISACLLDVISHQHIAKFVSVTSDELDLVRLQQWSKENNVTNLATVDINAFSSKNALQVLSENVNNQVLVIDDHLGDKAVLPQNVEIIELLPPTNRHLARGQIHPAFMFVDELLQLARGKRTGIHAFLVLAGIYGEGVKHLFPHHDIKRDRKVDQLARSFGRAITAHYIMRRNCTADTSTIRALSTLVLDSPTEESIYTAAHRVTQMELAADMIQCSRDLSAKVESEAARLDLSTPWVSTSRFNVYLTEVGDGPRIVNLVASETRNRIKSGISIALQKSNAGIAVELRRTKDLHTPDLVKILLGINNADFVSRGGHPMACGATVFEHDIEVVLDELRSAFMLLGQ